MVGPETGQSTFVLTGLRRTSEGPWSVSSIWKGFALGPPTLFPRTSVWRTGSCRRQHTHIRYGILAALGDLLPSRAQQWDVVGRPLRIV